MSTNAPEIEGITVKMIPVYIMGKRYDVPDSLTIMKAMEYAGYQFVRGAGCRGGICGACGTVFRKPGDYRIHVGLACQTMVEPNMYLTQIPFYPAMRASYDWESVEPTGETVAALYPELFRCVACNACTKICPMDVQVMDYIAELKRGDIKAAAETSFDCIQCGLCASRCMGELPQYHIAQLARRLYGGKLAPKTEHLNEMVKKIADGFYREGVQGLMKTDEEKLKKLYTDREQEPHQAPENWKPKSNEGL
ncbi:MAG: 4Fe-4S dicluster domain-containing protein [Pseudomonadota bacterium]